MGSPSCSYSHGTLVVDAEYDSVHAPLSSSESSVGSATLCSGPACGSPAGAVANSSRNTGSAMPGLEPADDAVEPTRSTSSESARWKAFCLRVADAVGVALADSVCEAVGDADAVIELVNPKDSDADGEEVAVALDDGSGSKRQLSEYTPSDP